MAKKEKRKKVKSVLGVPIDYDLGKKVKDISIDIDKYKVTNLVLLIILNILLAGTLVYYLSIVSNALLICVSVFIMIMCLVWSVISYKKGIITLKYTLYENAVVKDYDSSINVGVLEKLIGIRVVSTFIDKIGSNKTKTIILRFDNKWCSKIGLTCVNEDVDEIIHIIQHLRMKKINNIIPENKDTLISKMINKKEND